MEPLVRRWSDTYTMVVHGWSGPNAPLPYKLDFWAVPLATGGSLKIDSAPTAATLGTTGTIDVSWFNLPDGVETDWYLGAVSHTGDVGLMCLTLIAGALAALWPARRLLQTPPARLFATFEGAGWGLLVGIHKWWQSQVAKSTN